MKLYFGPGACSFVPHTMLEASGTVYEPAMVKLHKGEHLSPEYLAINPYGQVPVLIANDLVITQIVAICDYLASLFPENQFLPVEQVARAKALSIFCWMNNTVHASFTHFLMPQKFTSDVSAQVAIKASATQLYAAHMLELQNMVARVPDGQWLSGVNFGPLDAYALTLLRWGTMTGIDPTSLPTLWTHVNKVAQLPAVACVIERERLQLSLFKPA